MLAHSWLQGFLSHSFTSKHRKEKICYISSWFLLWDSSPLATPGVKYVFKKSWQFPRTVFFIHFHQTGKNSAFVGDYFQVRINSHLVAAGWYIWDWININYSVCVFLVMKGHINHCNSLAYCVLNSLGLQWTSIAHYLSAGSIYCCFFFVGL